LLDFYAFVIVSTIVNDAVTQKRNEHWDGKGRSPLCSFILSAAGHFIRYFNQGLGQSTVLSLTACSSKMEFWE